ncbi:MAG: hypothetical protein H0T53_12330 [Herpetosiphonaceae bacterium]|nr:hypothetical protein [Herpetosiphonaceae bacterium]
MSDLHPSFERATGDAVAHFQPLIAVITAIANGDETRRAEVEYLLPQIDNNGWQIERAVQRIWQGERDATALTTNLDANSAAIVQAVLAAVAAPVDAEEQSIAQIVAEWRPIILTVAAACLDVGQARQDIDGFLPQLESQAQWANLAHRMRLLLAGDRNRERLLAHLDPTDTVVMSAILHSLEDRDSLVKLLKAERDRAAAEEH